MLPATDTLIPPTHWSFGHLASLVGAPAAYLRQCPAPLAAINLQYGLTSNRAEQIKTLETYTGRVELRAAAGPDYGRIYDHELVDAVQRIAGNGTEAGRLPTARPTSTPGASTARTQSFAWRVSTWGPRGRSCSIERPDIHKAGDAVSRVSASRLRVVPLRCPFRGRGRRFAS
jgi:hypothetical protein